MKFAQCHPEEKHAGKGLCIKCYNQEYYKNNLNRVKENSRQYRENNKEYYSGYNKQYRNGDIELSRQRDRAYYLKSEYGISVQDYEIMLFNQNGLCAICGIFMDKPCIDHNHETGVVRSLLCNNCNLILGFSYDDTNILHAAIYYLELHRD